MNNIFQKSATLTLLTCCAITSEVAMASNVQVSIQDRAVDSNHNYQITEFHDAKIRLGAGNGWTKLGDLHPGSNTFNIKGNDNSDNGILRATLPNELTVVSIFHKEKGSNKINLTIQNNPNFKAKKTVTATQENRSFGLYDNKFATIVNNKINNMNILKNGYHNYWTSTCGFSSGKLECTIGSNPVIYFESPYKELGGGGFVGGFTTNQTPQKLLTEKNITVSGGPVTPFFVLIKFNNNLAQFNGTGGSFLAPSFNDQDGSFTSTAPSQS